MEPRLGHERPTFLIEYPASMASLARLKPGDPSVAERLELYAQGLELANGFSELTDAAEQRRRLVEEQAFRRSVGAGRCIRWTRRSSRRWGGCRPRVASPWGWTGC